MEYFTVKDWIRIKNIINVSFQIEGKQKAKTKYSKEFKEKQKLIKSTQWFCTECWSKEYLQVHHIDKIKSNNSDINLVLLCYNCHSKYHKHMQWKNQPKWMKK